MIKRNNIVCKDGVLPLEELLPKEVIEELCGRYICVHVDDLQGMLGYISSTGVKFKVLHSYECVLRDEVATRIVQITGESASEREVDACLDKLRGMSGIWDSVSEAVTKCVSEVLDISSNME